MHAIGNNPVGSSKRLCQAPPRARWGSARAVRSFRTLHLVLFVVPMVGCTNLPPAERESLRLASAQHVRGDNQGAMNRLDRIIRDYPNAMEIGEAYYVRGLSRAAIGQDSPARQDFEQAIRNARRDDLTAKAKASLAAILYGQGDWHGAARLYAEALPALPDGVPNDQIMYYAGVAMQRSGQWSKAREQFGRILYKYASRPVARSAARQAAWKHDFFCIQLGVYSSVSLADKAVGQLRARGFDVSHEFANRDGRGVWLILSGKYQTYAEAVGALNRARRGQADAVIVP